MGTKNWYPAIASVTCNEPDRLYGPAKCAPATTLNSPAWSRSAARWAAMEAWPPCE